MTQSDIPDDKKVIESLGDGKKDEAAHRLLDDLMKIEHGPGTPQEKLKKEQEYLGTVQYDAQHDRDCQRLGFPGISEIWTVDAQGRKSAPKLVSDINHNRVLDSKDLQVDLKDSVLGDHLTGHTLKNRTMQALRPKMDTSANAALPKDGMLQGIVDTSEQKPARTRFELGAQKAFVKSDVVETLSDGRTVDWTKWHHDMVFAAKQEFDQLLAESPELTEHSGPYAPTGSVKLRFDVNTQGGIEFRGCEAPALYQASDAAKARFDEIAKQSVEHLAHKRVLIFPPGSQRSVNSVELDISVGGGNSAQWQKNDRERVRQ